MPHGPGSRLPGYDYATPNWYFITTVIEGRRPLLGELNQASIVPSPIGRIILEAWDETLRARPWVQVDTMLVMPDHVHAVIGWNDAPTSRQAGLGRFVGQFKGIATRKCHDSTLLPHWDRFWQEGFWDRVIRNDRELQKIREYVESNPRRAWLRGQRSPR